MDVLISALILGLAGSLHCAGMCGPIALSIPFDSQSKWNRVSGILIYNTGRILMYALMGALFGLLGQGFSMLGFQKWISVIMGCLMLLAVFMPKLFHPEASESFSNWVRKKMVSLFSKASLAKLFLIGALNSLLPCGLVYLAIAGAIGSGDFFYAMAFMLVFGLGTLPMLFAFSFLAKLMSARLRNKMNKGIPFAVVIVGLIFILRGLTLGIPYLSPPEHKLSPSAHETIENHHKSCCDQ